MGENEIRLSGESASQNNDFVPKVPSLTVNLLRGYI